MLVSLIFTLFRTVSALFVVMVIIGTVYEAIVIFKNSDDEDAVDKPYVVQNIPQIKAVETVATDTVSGVWKWFWKSYLLLCFQNESTPKTDNKEFDNIENISVGTFILIDY